MNIREQTEKNERLILCESACLSENTKGRLSPETQDEVRTSFQRDRDRIIHCRAFRRLKHKTQVFLAPEGDYYRTRLTHTLEVAQIARTIARALRLNEDLTEAIALGHDLGHTPFGHAGERALNAVASFGFKHFEQSLRVVDRIEKNGVGLNLTYEVRDGIVCHTTGKEADTLEGRIVKISDKIAYVNHDIDDAKIAGVISENDIPENIRETLGNTKTERINTLVMSVINNSGVDILYDDKTNSALDELYDFLYINVYTNPVCKGEEAKAQELIVKLFKYFYNNPEKMKGEYLEICKTDGVERAACDYVAGMSDSYLLRVYNDLFIPKAWESLKNAEV